MSRDVRWWGGLVAIFLAAAIAVFYFHRTTTFDPVRWRSGPGVERQQMADVLVLRGTLKGMTKEEITQLLGERDGLEGSEWYYWLGPERGLFSIDQEALHIKFGDNDRVTTADIFSH